MEALPCPATVRTAPCKFTACVSIVLLTVSRWMSMWWHHQDLLGKMLTLDPAKRPKPEELLGHAFFATDTARSKQAATQPAQQPAA